MKFSELNLLSVGNTIQLVGAIWRGEGKVLLCFFPEDDAELYVGTTEFGKGEPILFDGPELPDEVETLAMSLEEWQKFVRQTDVMETEVLAQAEDGKLSKIILRKSARQISQGVSWKVFKRDRYACRYCGADDVPLTVDHLVLWEDQGPSTEDNLVACCRKCNKKRGNLPYDAWLKHPYYKKVSANLSDLDRSINAAIAERLDKVERVHHKHTKR
jgi:hypothetical protein